MKKWLLFLLFLPAMAYAQNPPAQTGDAKRGWQVFRTKGCMNCHKVGESSEESIGPDLSKVAGTLNETDLAASLWNHAPQMWEKTSERALSYPQFADQEVTDLFSFISFFRYLEEEGNPAQGRIVLDAKSCTLCHSLKGSGGKAAPDITGWSQYVNPLAWIQKMWQHAPQMLAEMRRMGIAWPTFREKEMENLIAYVRSFGSTKERLYLRTGDPANGKLLVESKNCIQCHDSHGPGPAFDSEQNASLTLGQLSGSMWNHAPQMLGLMTAKGIEKPSLSLKELADIVAYIFSVRFVGAPGDAKNGEKIFTDKGCLSCHIVEGSEEVPGKTRLKEKVSVPRIAMGLWNHGPNMLEAMKQKGISWPNLSGRDMADLVAFFKTKTEK